MQRPTLAGCDWDEDLFIARVAEYSAVVDAEIAAKEQATRDNRERIATGYESDAAAFDQAADADPDNREYNRSMAEERRDRARRARG